VSLIIKSVDSIGWHNNFKVYLLPFLDEQKNSYPKFDIKKPDNYIYHVKNTVVRKLKKTGTLKEWQNTVLKVCNDNHLHLFAILTALTAPMLKLVNEEGGFVHYMGGTSTGKSTILDIAKAVWGFETLTSFRLTDNYLEGYCKSSNDGAIFLDEIDEVKGGDLYKIIYMLANGVTKGRADKYGNARETFTFKILAQSSGEVGLEAKLNEDNLIAKGGQFVRIIELDADQMKGLGTFTRLSDNPIAGIKFENGAKQAEFLKEHAFKNNGIQYHFK